MSDDVFSEVWDRNDPPIAEVRFRVGAFEFGVTLTSQRQSLAFGRLASRVDVVIPDRTMAKIHGRVCLEGDKVILEDVRSSGGFWRDGTRFGPRGVLEPGATVKVSSDCEVLVEAL